MSSLGAVLVPTNGSEVDAIVGNMECWARSERHPFRSRPLDPPKLVFVFNNDLERFRGTIESAFDRHGMSRFFGELVFSDLNLLGEQDRYERDYRKEVGVQGFKAGPNRQFVDSMKLAAAFGRYTFLMESDCAVIRAGWLERLSELCEHPAPFWVLGSAYRGRNRLTARFSRHINGNAVYAAGDPEFQAFLAEVWVPWMRRVTESEDRRMAYDCILEWSFASEPGWPVWQRTAHRFVYTDFIQNLSGGLDLDDEGSGLVSRTVAQSPDTYILHNRNAARFVREVRVETPMRTI